MRESGRISDPLEPVPAEGIDFYNGAGILLI